MLQEVGGMAFPALRSWRGIGPAMTFSALAVMGWGYFEWTGTVSAVWPMLGVSNQLLAAFALAIGTSVLINMGKARYVWCTVIPLAFMCVNTMIAGWMNLRINYLAPQLKAGAPDLFAAFLAAPIPAKIQCVVTLVLMSLLVVVMADSIRRWMLGVRGRSIAEPMPAEAMPEAAAL
jgi:carbon starvation protein